MQHNLNERLIRSKLANYLARKTSLQAFHRWFVLATWDIEEWAPAQLQELVYEIKLRLAEYSNGHWSEAEFRRELSLILGFYSSSSRNITVEITSSSQAIRPARSSSAQTQSLMASV